ncbi:amino acid adenylation domain-containing protein [Chlorogloeopsis sp. ULAP01]|uniref:non-ribosomal peptide synthetase n=1 Tax=Chlorogloeopsis sp. ULAP01 TaxID=3056483 RepID=UPI0025AB2E41|nr:non-ribosomal peptide synthetase [Chlorogloeopsis sp. ULAP01]MDM9382031.1 amino acid adenylation domain-containing protein [Chlorogloeopsis sp. ULAP01]
MKDFQNFSEQNPSLKDKLELLAYFLEEEGVELDKTQTISPRENSDTALLSFAQQRLWFLQQLQPQSSAYNIPAAIRLNGQLNVAALEHSIHEIVRRHEVLRTTFMIVDQQPVQVVHSALTLVLPTIDLQDLPESERETKTLQLATEEAQKPFDLTQGPLLRAKLLCVSPQEHILLLTMHHIVSDGWSLGVLLRELAALYDAFSHHKSVPLPPLSIQYADFAVWQRDWLQGEVLSELLAYWKQQLSGNLPVLQLPTDRSRAAIQTFRGARQGFVLPKPLSEQIKHLCQQEGVTLFMTLLAAFKILLYRYTGQEDILVGSPVANRNHAEIENLIGLFINTLVLRTDLAGNPTFRELLCRVRQMVLEAHNHQDLPFEKLVETLQPERNTSYTPLFQVMFALQNTPMPALDFSGLKLSPLEIDSGTAKFDLTLDISETANGIEGCWEYNTDLFDASTIGRMTGHFQTLLAGMVACPNQRLSDLPLLTLAEQHQILVEWNHTHKEYPRQKCIHQLFEAQVERTPDAIAMVCKDEQITYRDLNKRANQLAHYLEKVGVQPEVRVGICVERSLQMIIGLLGILKAGGAYIPLDPSYPQERLAFMLQDAQAPILLTQTQILAKFPQHSAQVVYLDTDWKTIHQESEDNPNTQVLSSHNAYVLYTSGSTGKPKAVVIEHHSTVAFLDWARQVFTDKDLAGVLAATSICFDLSIFELFAPLCWGGKAILANNVLHLPNLPAKEEVTLINTVPSAIAELLRLNAIPTSVRTINLAGEPLAKKLVQLLYKHSSVQQIFNLYGPSEDTTYSTFALVKPEDSVVSIGRPITNTQVYVLDRDLKPVPIGIPGELYISGEGLARGYLNRSELTAQKFIRNPFSSELESRLYKTGDLVRYLPDGNLEYIGRLDHQVKIRGFRIELGEIEIVLSQHPAVQETIVVAREDIPGNKRLVAYLVLHQQPTPTISDLRRFLKQKLPEYMVPSSFVMLDTLPLTPNGKVDRRALPAPEMAVPERELTFVTPRNPIEEMLAGIWTNILGIEKVGIHDNFFELGGHSLLATQLISQVQTNLKVELPLRSLFKAPTVAGLAECIQTVRRSGQSTVDLPLLPMALDKDIPMSFAQARLWFLEQLQPGNSLYNIAAAIHIQGRLNVVALKQSFDEILRRHEALRTNFTVVDGQLIQVITQNLSQTLPIVDLQKLPEPEREIQVQQLAIKEAQQPFALERDPLLRTTLLWLDDEEYVLLLTMHHIVSDGWSIGVLFQEIAVLYEAFCTGKPSPLPEPSIQYADFAVWQRQWLQGEVLEALLFYWKQHLSGSLPVLELPTDRPRPAVPTFQGSIQSLVLPKLLTEKLKLLSHKEGVTLFITLLTVFKILLYHYTGLDDILVGSPIANRNRTEIEGLIGFFTNTLVLRTDLSGNPSFRELLSRVREVTLGAYDHQDLPLEKLEEELQPERYIKRVPLFQVMFVFQNTPKPFLEFSGLTLKQIEVDSGIVKRDLTLDLSEEPEGLNGSFEYNSDLFNPATIARMARYFQTLLKNIVTNPDLHLSELSMAIASRCD